MKMDQKMIIVSSIVGPLGVLSAILGFFAEGTKLTRSDVYVGYLGVCLYPPNPSLGLGVCASILLILAQTTFAVGGGCCGFYYDSSSGATPSATNRIVGVICAVFSWIAAVFALGLLVIGAAWNAPGTRDSPALGLCYVPMEGIFAGGAVLTLVATALALTSLIILRTKSAAATPMEGERVPASAAMAQPQFRQQPPQGQGCEQRPPNYHQQQQFLRPPEQGYRGHAPDNEQFPPASLPPAQGYGPHRPNLEAPPPQGHEHA